MEKHRGNFKLLILRKLRRILRKCFFQVLVKLWRNLKKSGEYFMQIFRHSKRKFRDIFASIFGKTREKLFEKHEIILRKFWNNQEKL